MEICNGNDCGCCMMEDTKNWVMPLLPLRDAPEQWATRRYSVTIDFFFPSNYQLQKEIVV